MERDFAREELTAMRLYYAEERSFAEIAAALGLPDARDAERPVRRLNARLRYHFVQASDASR